MLHLFMSVLAFFQLNHFQVEVECVDIGWETMYCTAHK